MYDGAFCENTERLLAVDYFRKKLHRRSLKGSLKSSDNNLKITKNFEENRCRVRFYSRVSGSRLASFLKMGLIVEGIAKNYHSWAAIILSAIYRSLNGFFCLPLQFWIYQGWNFCTRSKWSQQVLGLAKLTWFTLIKAVLSW